MDVDQLNCTNPFTGKKRRKGPYITKKRRDQIDKYNKGELNDKDARDVEELMRLYEISKMRTPIEDQVKDLQRKTGRGVLDYAYKGMKFYESKKILLIGSSGSGKSTNILNLLCESPNSFSTIHVICPQSTIDNEVYTTLRYYCKHAGITVYWSDSDTDEPLQFGNAEIKEKNGSSKFLHDNTLPMYVIFDDCYRGNKGGWISEAMSNAFIFWRHRMINTIVCLQSPNYMPSPVALNYSHLFMSGNFLEKEGVWSKVKMAVPDNIDDAVEDYNNTPDKRHQFYYIKADDSILHKYVPYKYSSKQQIIQKFKYKLPRGIDETIDIKRIRDAEKTAEEDDIAVTDQETYEKKQEQEIKKRPDTSIRNIQQEKQEEKKRKYYMFNGFKHYL